MEDVEGDPEAANKLLEQIGFNIGNRLIDEYLAKNEGERCKSFKDISQNLAVGLKMFLGIESKLIQKNEQEFVIVFVDNPLTENVTLPAKFRGLMYSNVICGAIRGACEAINIRVKCYFVNDRLVNPGNGTNPTQYEVKVELEEIIKKKLIDYDD